MPYASFDLFLTSIPTIPGSWEKIPSRRGTLVYKTPRTPTELVLRVLALDADHTKRICRKVYMNKSVTIPSNSVLQFELSKDREGMQVIKMSCVPGAGDGSRPLWEFYQLPML